MICKKSKIVNLVFCSFIMFSNVFGQNTETTPPNIIYIFTDQQFGGAMSNMGNPYLKTPAMDRISSSGIRFDNAYCTFPLCTPSRMSMFSGRMPHEGGQFVNTTASKDPFKFPMLGKLAGDRGYETHYIGKWHLPVAQNQKEVHGFNEIIGGGGYGGLDSMKSEKAVEFLEKKHESPFFLVVSFNNPHDCCELSRGDELRMGSISSPPGIDDLPPLQANFEIPTNEPEYLRQFQKDYPRVFPSLVWNDQQFREYIWGYYRLVEKVDKEIEKILDALEAFGLDDNTVIIFSSDHGDGLGMHRWNQKFSLYDEASRVPFIISWKGKIKAGQVSNVPISSGLDLLPTICDFAGIEIPNGSLGTSLRNIAEGKSKKTKRKYIVSETGFGMWAKKGEDVFKKARMVRSDKYKYILYDSGENRDQLFDMINDPGETKDLSMDSNYSKIVKKHQDYLKDWCKKTNDSFEIN